MNAFHRHQLRLVWKFNWKMKVRNTKLYEICNCGPISEEIKRSRWGMLGHALRMNKETPRWKAMKYYFESIYEEGKFRGRPRTTLVSIINEDIKTAQQKAPIISTLDPLQKLQDMRKLAEDRRTECLVVCKLGRTSYISKTKTHSSSSFGCFLLPLWFFLHIIFLHLCFFFTEFLLHLWFFDKCNYFLSTCKTLPLCVSLNIFSIHY